MSDWIKRKYRAEWDEDGIVFMWLKNECRARAGRARGAHVEASREEVEFWDEQRPLVEWYLQHTDVDVICDPERSEPSNGRPPVIWAFAATSGDMVHQLIVKRSARELGLADDLIRDLLGDRLTKVCGFTSDLHEFAPARRPRLTIEYPKQWYPHFTWLLTEMAKR